MLWDIQCIICKYQNLIIPDVGMRMGLWFRGTLIVSVTNPIVFEDPKYHISYVLVSFICFQVILVTLRFLPVFIVSVTNAYDRRSQLSYSNVQPVFLYFQDTLVKICIYYLFVGVFIIQTGGNCYIIQLISISLFSF